MRAISSCPLTVLMLLLLTAQVSLAAGTVDLRYGLSAEFTENVDQLALQDPIIQKGGVHYAQDLVGVWSRCFTALGYDYNASVRQAVSDTDPENYRRLRTSGGIDYIMPVLRAFQEERWEEMLRSGWITAETAAAAFSFAEAIGMIMPRDVAVEDAAMDGSAADEDGDEGDAGKEENAPQEGGGKICGTVEWFPAAVPGQRHMLLSDEEEGALGVFFFDETDETCLRLAQEGQFICVTAEKAEAAGTAGDGDAAAENSLSRAVRALSCSEPN